jgi:ABC-type molybdate transport system substrate-binding protein
MLSSTRAIADPAVAPYGAAAVETMKKLGLYETRVIDVHPGTARGLSHSSRVSGLSDMMELPMAPWS